jgi:formylglycine-generating enzyme required for sulfatase activity
MKLARIPAGKFRMGSPWDERFRDYEETQHDVEITKDFWMGVHEVTQKQFKAVMGYNPSSFAHDGQRRPGASYMAEPGGRRAAVPVDTGDFPVENVAWAEACEFCEKLTALPAERGRKYRLPTEAEWEFACRGGASSYQVFSLGNALSSKDANFNGNYPYGDAKKGTFLDRTCKVGSYKKNGFGLFDMHGNVWDWCSDWYGEDYYEKSPRKDPQGPSHGKERVMRGGGLINYGGGCRSANRNQFSPRDRSSDVGFRVLFVPAGK